MNPSWSMLACVCVGEAASGVPGQRERLSDVNSGHAHVISRDEATILACVTVQDRVAGIFRLRVYHVLVVYQSKTRYTLVNGLSRRDITRGG